MLSHIQMISQIRVLQHGKDRIISKCQPPKNLKLLYLSHFYWRKRKKKCPESFYQVPVLRVKKKLFVFIYFVNVFEFNASSKSVQKYEWYRMTKIIYTYLCICYISMLLRVKVIVGENVPWIFGSPLLWKVAIWFFLLFIL